MTIDEARQVLRIPSFYSPRKAARYAESLRGSLFCGDECVSPRLWQACLALIEAAPEFNRLVVIEAAPENN